MNARLSEQRRRAGEAGRERVKAAAFASRASLRTAVMKIMADLSVHAWADVVAAVDAPPQWTRRALNDLVEMRKVVRVARGFWASARRPAAPPAVELPKVATALPSSRPATATAESRWGYSDAIPISRRDPNTLTRGEAHALAHLCEWLEVHQSVTVAALEGLSERLQADTGCNRREADALIEDWLRALIDKGRVEVNGPLIRIKANRAGAGLVLRLVEAGAASDELDDDEGD